jgi:hypothetical protein
LSSAHIGPRLELQTITIQIKNKKKLKIWYCKIRHFSKAKKISVYNFMLQFFKFNMFCDIFIIYLSFLCSQLHELNS